MKIAAASNFRRLVEAIAAFNYTSISRISGRYSLITDGDDRKILNANALVGVKPWLLNAKGGRILAYPVSQRCPENLPRLVQTSCNSFIFVTLVNVAQILIRSVMRNA